MAVKGFDLMTPGWGRPRLEQETLRVYDICDGCRRCFNLCPSFHTLLDRIDEYGSETGKFTARDFEQVEQECYYCKLCYNHCPYTPPHQYALDFPQLMAAWKKQRVAEQGARWRDTLLIRTDMIGRLGSLTAPVANWALRTPWVRRIMERMVGIHRRRWVLPFQTESFSAWWSHGKAGKPFKGAKKKVAMFSGCLVNHQATDVGKASVQVLEKNGIEVIVPEGQRCCGMPSFDLGDTNSILRAAQENYRIFQPLLEQGYDIVAPVPSCSLMFKREYSSLNPSEEMAQLAAHTFDICEYLMKLKRDGALSVEFSHHPGRIAYQIPCHLRDQNIGLKSKELLELTGAQVQAIEKCSGHDGTWGAKVEFFDLSMTIARKAVRAIEDERVDLIASDCPLSALQLSQSRAMEQKVPIPALHPIQIVRDAYGLSS